MEEYNQKHSDLKRRLAEADEHNEIVAARIERTKRLIQRTRLERALLLERLEQATSASAEPDQVESPPASPILPEATAIEKTSERREESRRRSLPRDPRLPKRPQNAYIIFCDTEKDRVRRELEDKAPGETHDLTRAMSDAWKSLGPTGRKKYHELYREDRLRYIKEMAAFPSTGLSATDQKEKQRAVKQLREWETKQADPENGDADGDADEVGGDGGEDADMDANGADEDSDLSGGEGDGEGDGDDVTEDERQDLRIKVETTATPEPASEAASELASEAPSEPASELAPLPEEPEEEDEDDDVEPASEAPSMAGTSPPA